VDETGHRLHGIQDGAHHCLRQPAVCRQNAHRDSDQEGNGHGGQHDGQGQDHHVPITEGPHQEQQKTEHNAGEQMEQPPSQQNDDQNHRPPGKPSHEKFHIVQEGQGDRFDRIEESRQMGGQKTDQAFHISADVDTKLIRKLTHRKCASREACTSPLFFDEKFWTDDKRYEKGGTAIFLMGRCAENRRPTVWRLREMPPSPSKEDTSVPAPLENYFSDSFTLAATSSGTHRVQTSSCSLRNHRAASSLSASLSRM